MRGDCLYKYLEMMTGGKCYVGLHGITDIVTVRNEHSNFTKIEKAKSILNKGLVNYRGVTMKHTVTFFGDLSERYHGDEERLRFSTLNNYDYCKYDDEIYAMIIVAIPIIFEDSLGRKLFGGKIGYSSVSEESDRTCGCLTDDIFRQKIPPAMILGYAYQEPGDEYFNFVENNKYFNNLTTSEKDRFIMRYSSDEAGVVDLIDLNAADFLEEMDSIIPVDRLKSKTMNQFISHTKNPNIKKLENNYFRVNKLIPYTTEELDSILLDELDIERIIPNRYDILYSKYNIKDLMLTTEVAIKEGMYSLSSACYFNSDLYKDDTSTLIREYEKKLVDNKQDVDYIYSYWYKKNFDIFNDIFIDKIKNMKFALIDGKDSENHIKI